MTMKVLLLLAFVCAGAAAAEQQFNPDYDAIWDDFKRTYQKQYEPSEEDARRLIWEARIADIIRHNLEADLGVYSYRKGLNEYADIAHEELVQKMNGYKQKINGNNSHKTTSNSSSSFIEESNTELPDTVDWRKQGMVTPIKNQKDCGSCWAFSATGSLEGQQKNKTGNLVSLSEQNLVDCSGPEGNTGCEGGLMDLAFDYVQINKGIDTEQSYPYTAKDGTCHFKKEYIGATCTGHVDIPSGDEQALQKAVATIGPISVAIDATHASFDSYKSGIYDEPDCSSIDLDHGVLAIGYGTEDGVDYWLVKNSWGTSWGEKGFIKMSRNKNNQCGIATNASYPLV